MRRPRPTCLVWPPCVPRRQSQVRLNFSICAVKERHPGDIDAWLLVTQNIFANCDFVFVVTVALVGQDDDDDSGDDSDAAAADDYFRKLKKRAKKERKRAKKERKKAKKKKKERKRLQAALAAAGGGSGDDTDSLEAQERALVGELEADLETGRARIATASPIVADPGSDFSSSGDENAGATAKPARVRPSNSALAAGSKASVDKQGTSLVTIAMLLLVVIGGGLAFANKDALLGSLQGAVGGAAVTNYPGTGSKPSAETFVNTDFNPFVDGGCWICCCRFCAFELNRKEGVTSIVTLPLSIALHKPGSACVTVQVLGGARFSCSSVFLFLFFSFSFFFVCLSLNVFCVYSAWSPI